MWSSNSASIWMGLEEGLEPGDLDIVRRGGRHESSSGTTLDGEAKMCLDLDGLEERLKPSDLDVVGRGER
jgi:hypothetical protein